MLDDIKTKKLTRFHDALEQLVDLLIDDGITPVEVNEFYMGQSNKNCQIATIMWRLIGDAIQEETQEETDVLPEDILHSPCLHDFDSPLVCIPDLALELGKYGY